MFNLLLLGCVAGLSFLFYHWRRSSFPYSRVDALIFTFLYCLGLGLALRLGARTYPGIYVPDSPFLNGVLNSNGLFVGIGYGAVLMAGAADGARILFRPSGPGIDNLLRTVSRMSIWLAGAIALYGLLWAAFMQRLPCC
ncbi:hypothetical protein [Sandaracinobacter sp.]|jgi:hypothetical protein|uniref:hypothetical protein n=1 Tax=Sandaracinobacter sp. TaxID=2487581 RepID=UPI0035AE44DD